MHRFMLAIFCALFLGPLAIANAQEWPVRPIRFVISFGPGSASDGIARILTDDLSKQLGQPIVIIHKPGADGAISAVEVQRSAPDGYTFLFGTNSALLVAPNLRKTPPYNVLTDFTPVGLVGLNTLFFAVHPSVPAKNMAELVAHVRANPGKINAATGHTYGIVSTGLFAQHNGLQIHTIPYKGEPEIIVDLLAGRVHMMVGTSTAFYAHTQAGNLRVLAASTDARNPLWPNTPTLIESGQPPHPFAAFFAVVGPAGLSAAIAERMNREIAVALAKPEAQERMKSQGVIARSMTVLDFTAYLKTQNEMWKKALADSGVEPQ
ncbi:MAG: tripartite tricarboxylate transporter substrate binding protein [Acetobacteraceae bacterium]|nr:tripartite tricarboxylate transporter substrate binding protein [Acetobacteraceae bacterium]